MSNECECGCADCKTSAEWGSKWLSEPLLEAALFAGVPYSEHLGAITAEQAADAAFPHSQVSSKAGFTQTVYDNIVSAARAGTFSIPLPSNCQGTSQGGNIKLIQMTGGLALQGVSMGLTGAGIVTASALAPFTLGISALIGLFPLFFSHHSAAVAKEQKVICSVVPAANNYLQVIDQAVQSGATDPQHAITALHSLLSDFTSQVSSIIKNNSSQCNAACVWVKQLTAIVAMKESEYEDLEAGTAAQVMPSRPNTTSPAGVAVPASSYASFYPATSTPAAPSSLPSWLPIAAAIGIGLLLFERN